MTKEIPLITFERKHPELTFDAQDIEIIAKHYGYDYAQYAVKGIGFNGKQTGIFNFCLIDRNGELVEDLDWRNDVELLKKFYIFDKEKDFIEKDMTFEEFLKRIQRSG